MRNGLHGPQIGGNEEGHVLGAGHMAPGAQEEAPGPREARADGAPPWWCAAGASLLWAAGVWRESEASSGGGGGIRWPEASNAAMPLRPPSCRRDPTLSRREPLGVGVLLLESGAGNVRMGRAGFMAWGLDSGLECAEEEVRSGASGWGAGVSMAIRMTLKQRYRTSVSCTE